MAQKKAEAENKREIEKTKFENQRALKSINSSLPDDKYLEKLSTKPLKVKRTIMKKDYLGEDTPVESYVSVTPAEITPEEWVELGYPNGWAQYAQMALERKNSDNLQNKDQGIMGFLGGLNPFAGLGGGERPVASAPPIPTAIAPTAPEKKQEESDPIITVKKGGKTYTMRQSEALKKFGKPKAVR